MNITEVIDKLSEIKYNYDLEEDEFEAIGDDGTFTFFINLVEGYFSKNSLSEVKYPIGNLSMDEMFKIIVENG